MVQEGKILIICNLFFYQLCSSLSVETDVENLPLGHMDNCFHIEMPSVAGLVLAVVSQWRQNVDVDTSDTQY